MPSIDRVILYKTLFLLTATMIAAPLLWSQPMAWHDDAPMELTTGPAHAAMSEDEDPALYDYTTETEHFLSKLIHGHLPHTPDDLKADYKDVVDYFSTLKEAYGSSPWFFESWHHPLAQQRTGYNFGRCGMPIIESRRQHGAASIVDATTQTPEADIHYTIDGTTPNSESPLWQDQMVVDRSQTLRVKAIRSDLEHSPVLTWKNGAQGKERAREDLNEDKIMGIFPVPGTDEVIVKYKTKEEGLIRVHLIDDKRQSTFATEVVTPEPQFGFVRIDTADIPSGTSYLIKFSFVSGKTTYRQVSK